MVDQVTQHLPTHTLRRVLELQNSIARDAKQSDTKAAQILGTGQTAESSSLESLGLVSGRKIAQASVQGLDQLRKLVLPDALVTVVGGGIMGAAGAAGLVSTRLTDQPPTKSEFVSKAKQRLDEKTRQELDNLLASSCVYCDMAIASIDKPFLAEGEEEI